MVATCVLRAAYAGRSMKVTCSGFIDKPVPTPSHPQCSDMLNVESLILNNEAHVGID